MDVMLTKKQIYKGLLKKVIQQDFHDRKQIPVWEIPPLDERTKSGCINNVKRWPRGRPWNTIWLIVIKQKEGPINHTKAAGITRRSCLQIVLHQNWMYMGIRDQMLNSEITGSVITTYKFVRRGSFAIRTPTIDFDTQLSASSITMFSVRRSMPQHERRSLSAEGLRSQVFCEGGRNFWFPIFTDLGMLSWRKRYCNGMFIVKRSKILYLFKFWLECLY